MGKSLEEWVDGEPGARRLYEELECHASSAGPEEFARLAMISVRQWVEQHGLRTGVEDLKGFADSLSGSPDPTRQTPTTDAQMMARRFGSKIRRLLGQPQARPKRMKISFDFVSPGEMAMFDTSDWGFAYVLTKDGKMDRVSRGSSRTEVAGLEESEQASFCDRCQVPLHPIEDITVADIDRLSVFSGPDFAGFSEMDEVIVVIAWDQRTAGVLGLRGKR